MYIILLIVFFLSELQICSSIVAGCYSFMEEIDTIHILLPYFLLASFSIFSLYQYFDYNAPCNDSDLGSLSVLEF